MQTKYMTQSIPDYTNSSILVIGDLMLDRYWHGSTSRISPEAPVPVVHIHEKEDRAGGAGNVALNIAALEANCILLGLCGDDEAGEELETLLARADIKCFIERQKNIPTITKLRVLSRHQQLIRLDFEKDLRHSKKNNLTKVYQQQLANCNAVILSDYNKGTLADLHPLIDLANQHTVPIFVDPKTNDYEVYRGATIITPNKKEFETVVGKCHSNEDYVTRATNLIKQYELDAMLITRGEEGMTLVSQSEPALHLPAQAKEVFDVTGAGDTVIATLASSVAAGESLQSATALANYAAGIVVTKLGAATANRLELAQAARQTAPLTTGIVTLEELLQARHDAHAHNETIVFTNGCFDILHAGHIAYLEEAKAFGNRLIVAVNDDDSVKRLKGDTRPTNNIQQRMQVLAALRAVDWVIPFSNDTPKDLIETLIPDVLVKGGDWKVEDIVGSATVIANGGEVLSLNYVQGQSTTGIIEAIKSKEDSQ